MGDPRPLNKQILTLLSDLEKSGKLSDAKKVRTFFCACSRLIWHHLPPEAQIGVEIAEKYNRGEETTERLVDQRVKLWNLWQETPDHYNSPTKEAKALRSAICCLYESYEDGVDPYMAIDFAMDCCNSVELHEQDQLQLLHAVFD
jgi:hypothetical protein